MKKLGVWFGLLCILQGVVPMQVVAEVLPADPRTTQSDGTTDSLVSDEMITQSSATNDSVISSTVSEEAVESSTATSSSKENTATTESDTSTSETESPLLAPQDLLPKKNKVGDFKYVTLTSDNTNLKLFQDLTNLNVWNTPTKNQLNKTYQIKEVYRFNEQDYYLLGDSTSELGYVVASAVKPTTFSQGSELPYGEEKYFVAVTETNALWKDFSQAPQSTKSILRKTLKAKGYYLDFDGTRYEVLVDRNGAQQGIVKTSALKATNAGGIYQSAKQYVTFVKNNSPIYNNFALSVRSKTNTYYLKTYEARGFYLHFNGTKYLTIYDNKGKWIGYVPENFVKTGNGKGGIYQSSNRYITFTSANYAMYSNFNFKKLRTTKGLYKKTYQARGYYEHFNGARYYTVYDNKGKWLGYVNAASAKTGNGKGGIYQSSNRYITFTSANYTMYSNFNFKKLGTTKNLYKKTYQARGYYEHFNGARYYTVYDNKGKWLGYVNAASAKTGNGKGGMYQKLGDEGVVISRNYATYTNFNFKKRGKTSSVFNQSVQVRGYYQHFNGAKYYTIYNAKGKWLGYVNSAAVRIKKGAATYLGTSRARVLKHLKANEKNGFYVGTRYRGLGYGGVSNQEVFMQPKGNPNKYGQGMNCTGFVAAAMRNSGANLAPISRLGYGGAANATLWRDSLKKNCKYYTYGSISALLKSGRAKKGDILYLEGRWGEYGADCHIGIFWGDNGHQNRFWHQVLAGNMISNIFSGTPYSMVYLFPQE
ncbi:hypothetical protein [Enterococcus canintestini]|uniref:NlpC/P60 domain-containing protein n=2 Tax=Enterococcus canintestini TaxID=317010 RepID=A0A267HWR2_9ENTE|nr:hypothetical protein [Enterococcus canintestini]PAB02048.1 hypothetical protein AKL21_00605 [Enterococcus canintestini]